MAGIESGVVADPKAKRALKLAVVLGVPVQVLLDETIALENWQDEFKSFRGNHEEKGRFAVRQRLKLNQ